MHLTAKPLTILANFGSAKKREMMFCGCSRDSGDHIMLLSTEIKAIDNRE
jgi:hypothetical protein